MTKPRQARASSSGPNAELNRLARPLSLTAQVEQALREAVTTGRFPSGRLPTEVELAEQLGVSRETVRLAAEALQREGLLVKIRRRGTFTQSLSPLGAIRPATVKRLGYVQADYPTIADQEEAVTRTISGLMLQGSLEEAGRAGYQMVVQHAPLARLRNAFEGLHQGTPLCGVIFASCAEEKLVKRVTGMGVPLVLLDHDLNVPKVSSVREDSFAGARQAVQFLASLGHRRIAFVNWRQTELNPWRLQGYRQGLRDAGLSRRRCWELEAELTERGARRAVETWLRLNPRPTALYCFNNTLARYVVEELRQRNLRVPHEVSVLGGGGEEVEGLTCLQADWHQQGRVAVQVLLRALAGSRRRAPEHLLVPYTLRMGQTTGVPASG